MAKNFKANEPCICCGLNIEDMVCYHHLYTQKNHPKLKHEKWNMIPVCQVHHIEIHKTPLSEMAVKYRKIEYWLIENGWNFYDRKWQRY